MAGGCLAGLTGVSGCIRFLRTYGRCELSFELDALSRLFSDVRVSDTINVLLEALNYE